MAHYMVFSTAEGWEHLDDFVWSSKPVGVYETDDPVEACKAAASDKGRMGMLFAVEGTPFGIALEQADAKRLSRKPPEVNYEELARKLIDRGAGPDAAELDAKFDKLKEDIDKITQLGSE